MNNEKRDYEYKPKWMTIIFCAAFFSMTTVVLGSAALNNNSGLVVNQVIQFGPAGATVFYWLLTVCSMGFVGLAASLIFHRVSFQQRLTIGADALVVPTSRWSRDTKKIAYRDILKLSKLTISHQHFLKITHTGGIYKVNAGMLPSKRLFEDFCELLSEKAHVGN